MDHLRRYTSKISNLTFLAVFLPGALGIGGYILFREGFGLSITISGPIAGGFFIILAVLFSTYLSNASLGPIEKVWQAIWHVSPNKSDVPAPKTESLRYGRELVTAMIRQIYDLASSSPGATANTALAADQQPAVIPSSDKLFEQIPLAIFVLDKDMHIKTANLTGRAYLGLPADKILSQFVYDVLHMSFTTEDTFEAWIKSVSNNRATDTRSWEHVRAVVTDKKEVKQFDMAASYSRDDSAGNEVVLALFDRTAHYGRQDQASSYVAMAVHELRTPLTVLRGYIEVFEDEIGPSLNPEYQDFMRKMRAAAQSLSAFVSNILNVARVDENQMTLQLHEANWNEVLPAIVNDLELRAAVRGKTLELDIEPALPTVGIDQISMYEVISNLVDNAIKYSGESQRIIVHARKKSDTDVETVVEDFGPGMPESTISQLFTKFYRSHRSSGYVGGSGLGLYLVKSIISAHGGQVWVQSHEGQGSKFGFTLQTFASINTDKSNPDGIRRQANGWIKNHSMYRR